MRRTKIDRGFTLIEVLIAMVIVGLSLSAVMFASSNGSNQLYYLQEKGESRWVANNVWIKTLSGHSGFYLLPTATNGETVMGQRKYSWQLTVAKSSDEQQLRIAVQVKRASDNALLAEKTALEPFYDQAH